MIKIKILRGQYYPTVTVVPIVRRGRRQISRVGPLCPSRGEASGNVLDQLPAQERPRAVSQRPHASHHVLNTGGRQRPHLGHALLETRLARTILISAEGDLGLRKD